MRGNTINTREHTHTEGTYNTLIKVNNERAYVITHSLDTRSYPRAVNGETTIVIPNLDQHALLLFHTLASTESSLVWITPRDAQYCTLDAINSD